MATCSSILVWRNPWSQSLVCYSPWGHKEADTPSLSTHSSRIKTAVNGMHVFLKTPEWFAGVVLSPGYVVPAQLFEWWGLGKMLGSEQIRVQPLRV